MAGNVPSSSHKMRIWSWVGLGAILITYVALSVRHIWCPGLGYDEVMWTSVAINRPDGGWIAWSIGRWPILLALPYIGTLKGYIYAPILTYFGANPLSIRLPMIILGAAGIAITFAAARRAIGTTSAMLIALFLAVNPEIVQRFRHDLGPAAIDFFLRAACLLLLLRYAEKERPLDALLFWVLASIGVWQKLTFIWYVNAYVLGFLLLQGRAWAEHRRMRGISWPLMPHVLAYCLVVAWVGWVYVTFHVGEVQASLGSGAGTPALVRVETLGRALGLFFQGMESIANFHDPFFTPGAAGIFLSVFLVFVSVGILRGLLESVRRPAVGIPFRGIITVAALAVTVQLAMTLPADKVWHRLSLEPFATCLAVDGLFAVAAAMAAFVSRPSALRVTYNTIICFSALGGVAYTAQIHRYLDTALCAPAVHLRSYYRAIQTPAIWQLLDFVVATDRRFVFLDWGMRNQALLMTREPNRVTELTLSSHIGVSGFHAGGEEGEKFAREYFTRDSNALFVLHGPEYTCIPAIRDAFFALAHLKQIPLHLIKVIEEDGATAFEIWEVEHHESSSGAAPPLRNAS